MMVAAGALEPRAKEELAEHGGEIGGFAPVAIDHRGTVAMVRALGKENFAHELIKRFVLPETFAQPLIERKHAFYAHAVGIRTEQVGPLAGPIVGVGRIVQHLCDELSPFARRIRSSRGNEALIDFGFRISDFGFRSEEHTSELQSQSNLVCRLLLEKKRCLLINRRSLLLALRLLWKTPIIPSNSRFPRLCAKCLLTLKRLVSILPMTRSKKLLARLVLRLT